MWKKGTGMVWLCSNNKGPVRSELQYKVRAYNPGDREIRFEILAFVECGESNYAVKSNLH